MDWRILWSKLARMGSEDWGFNFPRCALKKECASIRHSETVAFMAWRFIFVCAIVLKDEKNQKMTERSLTRVFGSVFSCNV